MSPTEMEMDALRELGNVAFSHAGTALSALVNEHVEISLPAVRIPGDAPSDGDAILQEGATVVTLPVLGAHAGHLALVLPRQDARGLEAALSEALASADALKPGAILEEVANIMAGSALLAMHQMLGVELVHGTPHLEALDPGSAARFPPPDLRPHAALEARFVVGSLSARGQMLISFTDLGFFLDALVAYSEGA